MVLQLFCQTRRSCALAAVLVLSGAVVAAEPPISFSRDIKGILSNRCGRCHGPDSEDRHGGGADGLRLDTFAGVRRRIAHAQPSAKVVLELHKRSSVPKGDGFEAWLDDRWLEIDAKVVAADKERFS